MVTDWERAGEITTDPTVAAEIADLLAAVRLEERRRLGGEVERLRGMLARAQRALEQARPFVLAAGRRRAVGAIETSDDEQAADHRLLAAAPDLLRIAVYLVALNGQPCRLDHEGFCQEHDVSRPCVVAEARRIVAQATGEEAS